MKRWNKKRQWSKWTAVSSISQWKNANLWSDQTIADAKVWCQRHPSPGRFYHQPYVGTFWFEFSEDALVFLLVWGKKVR